MKPLSQKSFYALALLGLLLPLYLLFTFDHSLWNPDETRDGGIAREVYINRSWAVPTLNGDAFLEKPPLYYWSTAIVYTVFGGRVTDGLTRLPAVLYGFLGALFIFLLGAHFGKPRAGFIAAVLLATSAQYYRVSHMALMDSAVAALSAGALYFFASKRTLPFVLFSVLAFYAKGFIAIALIGVVVATNLIAERNWRRLLRLLAAGVIGFLVLVSPWIYTLWKEGGSAYLKIFFIDNHFSRFASHKADHANNPTYTYFGTFIVDFLPWTFLFLATLPSLRETAVWKYISAWVRRDRARSEPAAMEPATVFAWQWLGCMLYLLTLSSAKRSIYLLPAIPAAAFLAGLWLEERLDGRALSRFDRFALYATTMTLSLLVVAIPIAWGVQHQHHWIAITALLFASAAIVWTWSSIREHNLEALFGKWVLLVGLVYGMTNLFFIRDLEKGKSVLPVVHALRAEMVRSKINFQAVAGYRMSEMERGVFPFYLDHSLTNLKTPEEAAAFVEGVCESGGNPGALLLNNNNSHAALETVLGPKATHVFQFRPAEKSRSFTIYRVDCVPTKSKETARTERGRKL